MERMYMKSALMILMLVSVAMPQSNPNRLAMPSLFSDNMVLQQKARVPIWGKAKPGLRVTVTASWGASGRTVVKSDGAWELYLRTPRAGGPYTLHVAAGDSTLTYRNVMSGEVWLCSGQSNMEIPLQGWPPENPIKNSDREIAAASYPDIRFFAVARAVSAKPEFNCAGTWTECNPQTAARFSAVGYFFGRKLYEQLHVPIGLIWSVWGGTKIQSWISGNYLSRLPEYKPVIGKIDSLSGEVDALNRWVRSHPAIDIGSRVPLHQFENLDFDDSLCSEKSFDDSGWKTMMLPTYWEATPVGDFDGAVWYRKTIEIPRSWVDSTLVLHLGPIDDMDETWVNGVKVGGLLGGGFWQTPRVYDVPGSLVRDTTLTIAVRVIDNGGGGGIWGNGVRMEVFPESDSIDTLPLSGDWKYLPVAEYINSKFYVYGAAGMPFYSRPKTALSVGPNTPTMLFNGMIAPLIPYHLKGILWYQGESNSDLPGDYNNYRNLFPLLISNWRVDWKEGYLPFYWVQIAPWTYGAKSKSYMIRDAQRLTLSIRNTGMAVTLDIGSLTTIHPPDKEDVGQRLALWALAKQYRKHLAYSGPIYRSMKVKNGKAIISFEYTGAGLVMKPLNGRTNFVIAGKDSNFVVADAKVVGNTLEVYSPEVKRPVAVRYTWGNAEEATLFNKEGLPASTFRTDDWPQ